MSDLVKKLRGLVRELNGYAAETPFSGRISLLREAADTLEAWEPIIRAVDNRLFAVSPDALEQAEEELIRLMPAALEKLK